MGDLLEYFEERSRTLDSMAPPSPVTSWNTNFTSCIRFGGVPILPPVLTQRRKTEMLTYKRQAMRREYRRRVRNSTEINSGLKSIIATMEEKRASRWSDSSPSSPKSTSSDTSKTKCFEHDQPSSITEPSSESDLSSLSRSNQSPVAPMQQNSTKQVSKTQQKHKNVRQQVEKPSTEQKPGKSKKDIVRKRSNSLERPTKKKTDLITLKLDVESPERSPTNSETNINNPPQSLSSLRRSSSMSSLPNPAKIYGVNSNIVPKPPTSQISRKQQARQLLRQYSSSNPDLRSVGGRDSPSPVRRGGSPSPLRKHSIRQSVSDPDLSNSGVLGEDNSYKHLLMKKQGKSSDSYKENANNKQQSQTSKQKKQEEVRKPDKKLEKQSQQKKPERNSRESAKRSSDAGSTKVSKTGTSNTENDFPSLENCNSLPEDIDGMPLTSVREQQISHTLDKLARVLNMEDTMSTLTSTSSTDILDKNTPQVQVHLPVHEEEAEDTKHSDSHSSDPNILVVHDDTSIRTDSTGHGSESAAEHSFGSNSSHSKPNPVSLSIRSSASSVTASHGSKRMSPKGFKNTVHFAPLVTEISTSASQSVEDKILMRKLDITPTNSLQISSVDAEPEEDVAASSSNNEASKSMKKIPKHQNDVGLVPPLVDISKAMRNDSMLSKVALSPDTDSTGDTPVDMRVPFGDYGHYHDNSDISTSDKENEFRKKQGKIDNKANDAYSMVPNILHARNIPPPHHNAHNVVKSSVVSEDGSQASTLKASQDILQSLNSNSSLSNNKNHQEQSQQPKSGVRRRLPVVNQEPSRHVLRSGITAHDGGQVRTDGRNTSVNTTPVEYDQYSKPQNVHRQKTDSGHEPPPILTHAVAHSHAPSQMSRPSTQQSNSQGRQRRLNVDAGDDINYTMQQSTTSDIDAEQVAKAEHLQRYLSHVQHQSLEEPSPGEVTKFRRHGNTPSEDGFDVRSTIQSFTASLQSLSNVDEEELLRIQAEHFEKLKRHLIEQQKQQLEELFVHQRREQFNLQNEIEVYQQQITEQQEFLQQNTSNSQSFHHQGAPHAAMQKSYPPNIPQNIPQGHQYQRNNYMPVPNQPQTPPKNSIDMLQDPNTSRQYSYISSPSLYFNPKERDNGSDISTFSKATPKQSLKFNNNSNHSTPKQQQHKPVQRSPVKQAFMSQTSHSFSIPERAFDPGMKRFYDKLSACVKGYLTRRLLRTEKVQEIIKTINDTKDFAISFQSETPIKRGNVNHQDRHLLDRIIAQLQGALLDIHEIFFEIPMWERMEIIAHSRQLWEEKRLRESGGTRSSVSTSQPRISAATLKALERKRKAVEEISNPDHRPRSAPPNTVLQQSHYTSDYRPQRQTQSHVSGFSTRPKEQSRPKTAPSQTVGPQQGAKGRAAKNTKPTTTKSTTAATASGKSGGNANKNKIGSKVKTKNNKAWRG